VRDREREREIERGRTGGGICESKRQKAAVTREREIVNEKEPAASIKAKKKYEIFVIWPLVGECARDNFQSRAHA